MLWWFAKVPESVACMAVLVAIMGYAWLTIELSGEGGTAFESGKDEPSLW